MARIPKGLSVQLPDHKTQLAIPESGSELVLGRRQHPALGHASISTCWVVLRTLPCGDVELCMQGSNPLEVARRELQDDSWAKVATLTHGQSLTVAPGFRFWVKTLPEASTCTIVQDNQPLQQPSGLTAIDHTVGTQQQQQQQRLAGTAAVYTLDHAPLTTRPDAVHATVAKEPGHQSQGSPPVKQVPVIDLTACDAVPSEGGVHPITQVNDSAEASVLSDSQAPGLARELLQRNSGSNMGNGAPNRGRGGHKRRRITGSPSSMDNQQLHMEQQAIPQQSKQHTLQLQQHDMQHHHTHAVDKSYAKNAAACRSLSEGQVLRAVMQQGFHQTDVQGRGSSASPAESVGQGAPSAECAESSLAAAQAALSRRDMPFKLLKVRHVAHEYNEGCLGMTLRQLLTGPMRLVVVMNMAVNLSWLMTACPELPACEQLVVCHGSRSTETRERLRQHVQELGLAEKTVLHAPPLPERWGTHHTKAFLVQYDCGVRVVIFTANAYSTDNTNKSQAIWWQDFPLKDSASPPTSAFEADLVDYCTRMKMPAQVSQRVLQLIASFDMSSARAHLIASVPGRHTGRDLYKYGHMRLRHLLKQEPLPAGAAWHTHSQLVMQCSSLGSVDEKWLSSEFVASLSAAASGSTQGLDSSPAKPGAVELLGASRPVDMRRVFFIWPTEQEVKDSLEGWAAGGDLPGSKRNVARDILVRQMAKFGGQALGRMRAMPHMKSYLRFLGQQVAWVMVGSHNLSKAAWGSLEKNGQQFFIRSYELGTLHTPRLEAAYRAHRHYGFSCTPPPGTAPAAVPQTRPPVKVEFWTLQHMRQQPSHQSCAPGSSSTALAADTGKAASTPGGSTTAGMGDASGVQVLHVPIPLPYILPPERYTPGHDVPWMVDAEHVGLDILGHSFEQRSTEVVHPDEWQDDRGPAYFVDSW